MWVTVPLNGHDLGLGCRGRHGAERALPSWQKKSLAIPLVSRDCRQRYTFQVVGACSACTAMLNLETQCRSTCLHAVWVHCVGLQAKLRQPVRVGGRYKRSESKLGSRLRTLLHQSARLQHGLWRSVPDGRRWVGDGEAVTPVVLALLLVRRKQLV